MAMPRREAWIEDKMKKPMISRSIDGSPGSSTLGSSMHVCKAEWASVGCKNQEAWMFLASGDGATGGR